MTDSEILAKAFNKVYPLGGTKDSPIPPRDYITQAGIIFSHSFAKAFWGEEMGGYRDAFEKSGKPVETIYKDWQWHLRQMVLEEEPLKYLEKFL
jgi:hypothetical protein